MYQYNTSQPYVAPQASTPRNMGAGYANAYRGAAWNAGANQNRANQTSYGNLYNNTSQAGSQNRMAQAQSATNQQNEQLNQKGQYMQFGVNALSGLMRKR